MKKTKAFIVCFVVFFLPMILLASPVWSQEYTITMDQFLKGKTYYDDPRPLYDGDLAWRKILPPEVLSKLSYDEETMKKEWADLIGFKAPDVVGKIAPDIKPGKYTYQDKDKFPGLKELMIPNHYALFKPTGPPLAGSFPEITVVPTTQLYHALPIIRETKKNMGRTKLDDLGYLNDATWVAGFPFPRPEGKFLAQQYIYNWEKQLVMGENAWTLHDARGWNRNLREDTVGNIQQLDLKLSGRVLMPPYGWFDERAKNAGEYTSVFLLYDMPRDMYGNAMTRIAYRDRDTFDSFHLYINSIRRVRKMSATDTQDAMGGTDLIFEDKSGFGQKLSPKRYPYKMEVIADREYLLPVSLDASEYIASKGAELRNVKFQRRPVVVLQLTQSDPNYVYSKRIIYIDKETFNIIAAENFDRKGRLYRTFTSWYYLEPKCGVYLIIVALEHDYIDSHSTMLRPYMLLAPWMNRGHQDLGALIKRGK